MKINRLGVFLMTIGFISLSGLPAEAEKKTLNNFYTIAELNQSNFNTGTYHTEGYVAVLWGDCGCPEEAPNCEPCLLNKVIISQENKKFDELRLNELSNKELVVFSEGGEVYKLKKGKKYLFLIQILDVKTTKQKLNNIKLIYFKEVG